VKLEKCCILLTAPNLSISSRRIPQSLTASCHVAGYEINGACRSDSVHESVNGPMTDDVTGVTRREVDRRLAEWTAGISRGRRTAAVTDRRAYPWRYHEGLTTASQHARKTERIKYLGWKKNDRTGRKGVRWLRF